MYINHEKFSDIENAFTRLKANESDIAAIRDLADALHSITGKNIKVNVIRPEYKNQECNVMSVYPEEDTVNKIINAIVTEQNDISLAKVWNESGMWVVEIDSRILSNNVNLTEKELAALILHEIGHIVYSNSVPLRIAKVIRLEFSKSNFLTKQLMKDNIFSRLLSFPIIHSCTFDKNKSSMKHELMADTYSIKAGYGDDLKNAMDKIFIYAGSGSDRDDDIKNLMGFSVDTLTMLQDRQNHVVRRNLAKMMTSTPSKYAKKIIGGIFNTLSGSNTVSSSVTESVKDNFIEKRIAQITNDFYASEAFFNRVHKMKKIDPADIDYIGLEVNNIKSNDDKMMIVSYIYNKLDIIDYYIALIDSKNPKYMIPHSRESLVNMRERLDAYRLDAINRKLPEVRYGISIQYPSGYEG